jgi:branched-chain amino acid transport system substrate-binding protein
MEAKAFAPMVKKFSIKKADFLATNNDFGLGASQEFSKMLKENGAQVGVQETMDPKATDFSAQLAKIKASGGDTLFVTTAVEQATLILRQAKEQQVKARIITTGRLGLARPAHRAGRRGGDGSYHHRVLHALVPRRGEEPRHRQEVRRRVDRAQVRGRRPHRGLPRLGRHPHHRRGDQGGGQGRAGGDPEGDVERAREGHQRRHRFIKQGPAGKESAQNVPSVYVVRIDNGKVGEKLTVRHIERIREEGPPQPRTEAAGFFLPYGPSFSSTA